MPSTAYAVNYRHNYFSGTIDEAHFSIALDNFKAWMAENSWDAQEFYTDDTGLPDDQGVYSLMLSEPVEVVSGFRYDEYDESSPDSGFSVVYDKDNHRAYMWHTTF